MVEDCEYFAPLSNPKPKHQNKKNTIDLLKINNGIYGVVNFNNMILVRNNNYTLFDLNKKSNNKNEQFRLALLRNQLRWLTSNKKEVLKKSRLLYKLYKENKLSKSLYSRSCNFPLLEEKCIEYNIEYQK